MQRLCDTCKQPYEAKRATSRFCSQRCQKRAVRSPAPLQGADVIEFPPAVDGAVTAATMAELLVADRVNSSAGQVALILARRLDSPGADTGSSMAAVAKEYKISLRLAIEGSTTVLDVADELRLQRQARIRRQMGLG